MRRQFCGLCGGVMQPRRLAGKDRQVCRDCKVVQYPDVRVAVSAIVYDRSGRILLVKRAIEPGYGRWVSPGGYAEQSESLAEAAVRETREETLVDLGAPVLAGVYGPGSSGVATIVYMMAAESPQDSGTGPETQASRFFDNTEIPWDEVYFPSTREAIRDWFRNWSQKRSDLTRRSDPE
jgi:ADP-ribose pyrophosphatase YjhB (NUDIX family)